MNDFWSPVQKIIEEVCAQYDSKWQIRKRVIDTHFLVLFIFKVILSKNQQGYKSILNELWEQQELSRYKQTPISSSSLCEARQKLSEELFIELNNAVLLNREKVHPLPLWRGHRIFAADGSKINLPRELLLVGYRAPNKEQYYPQGIMSTIYHLGSGLVYDCLLSKDKSERHCVLCHMEQLTAGDVLVLDRGYFSYLLLYQAVEKGIHLICRLQSGTMNKEIKAFWDSPLSEAIIEYFPSAAVKSEIKKQGYDLNYKKIKLRLIKYKIDDEVYICATTLIGDHYPANEFPGIYHGRWGIEELYKISKRFINIEEFHSKTERGVKQELYAHVLLINIARIFELEANNQIPPPSKQNDEKKNDELKGSYWQDFCGKIQGYKINFKNCLLIVGRHIERLMISIGQETEDWLSKIVNSIAKVKQKIRPGRHYPRKSRKPRSGWRSSNTSKSAGVGA